MASLTTNTPTVACYPTTTTTSPSSSVKSSLSFSSSLSYGSCSTTRRRRRRRVKVVTAVAKYKGTIMREKHLTEMIEKKIEEAKQVCQGDATSDGCKVAWDEVEEISQAKADLRRKINMEDQDPLESFCQHNPETDECRIYED